MSYWDKYYERLARSQTTELLRSDIAGWLVRGPYAPLRRPNARLRAAWKKELEAREAMQREKEKEKEKESAND